MQLKEASKLDRFEIIKLLIQYKANLNEAAQNGSTPIYWASAVGNKEIVNLLLQNGAHPNAGKNGRFIPLHAASKHGHKAVVESLLLWGADSSTKNNEGKTALDIAQENNHTEIAQLLENLSVLPLCLQILKSIARNRDKVNIPDWFPQPLLERED